MSRNRWVHARWVEYYNEWVLLLDRFGALHHEHALKDPNPDVERNNRTHALTIASEWVLNQGYNGMKVL